MAPIIAKGGTHRTHPPVAGDVGPAFHDYSHTQALNQLLWFIDFWPTQATPSSVGSLLRYYETFACEPRLPVRRAAGHRRPISRKRPRGVAARISLMWGCDRGVSLGCHVHIHTVVCCTKPR